MYLRTAIPEDIPVLAQMRWEFATEGAPPQGAAWDRFATECTAFLRRALEGERWVIWVAEVDAAIVSHIYLQAIEKVPRPDEPRNRYAYMTNVYTRPAFRGQGIGGRLLQRACEWARSEGMEFVIVWPSEESVPFYTRQGFRPVREALELSFEDGSGSPATPEGA